MDKYAQLASLFTPAASTGYSDLDQLFGLRPISDEELAARKAERQARIEALLSEEQGVEPSLGRIPDIGGDVKDKMVYAKNYLESQGVPSHIAAGAVGNIMAESGGRTSAVGDAGASVGAFQWNKERLHGGGGYTGLIPFAKAAGASPYDFKTQLDYFIHELKGPENKAYLAALGTKTPEEAAAALAEHYERPLGKDYSKRMAYARMFAGPSVQAPAGSPADQMLPAQPEVDMSQFDLVTLTNGTEAYIKKGLSPEETIAKLQAQGIDALPTRPMKTPSGENVLVRFNMSDDEALAKLKESHPEYLQRPSGAPAEEDKSGALAAFKKGVYGGVAPIATGLGGEAQRLGEYLGPESTIGQYATEAGTAMREYGAETAKKAEEAFKIPEDAGFLAKNIGYPFMEGAGQLIPYGAAFAVPGAGLGTAVGLTALYGGAMGEAEQKAKEVGKEFVPEEARPWAGADVAINMVGLRMLGPLKNVFGPEAVEAPQAFVRGLIEKEGIEGAKAKMGTMVTDVLKGMGVTGGANIANEVAEDMLYRGYAGQDLFNEDALQSYLSTAKQVAPIGIGMGGVHGVAQRSAKVEALTREQEQREAAQAEAAQMEREREAVLAEDLKSARVGYDKLGIESPAEAPFEQRRQALDDYLASREAEKEAARAELPEDLQQLPMGEAQLLQRARAEGEKYYAPLGLPERGKNVKYVRNILDTYDIENPENVGVISKALDQIQTANVPHNPEAMRAIRAKLQEVQGASKIEIPEPLISGRGERPQGGEEIGYPAEGGEGVRVQDQEGQGLAGEGEGQKEVKFAKAEEPTHIDADGVQRPVHDSTGQRIHTTDEGVKNFWKGFEGTKVTDEEGRPIRVYHGTDEKFNTFEMNRKTQRGVMLSQFDVESQGAFFSPSKIDAEQYGRNVDAYYLKIHKPLSEASKEQIDYILEPAMYERSGRRMIDTDNGISSTEVDSEGNWINKVMADGEIDWDFLDKPEVVARMKELGFDGAKVYEPNDSSGHSWFVVDPKQIKSATGNLGKFDTTKPDIREARGVAPEAAHSVESLNDHIVKTYGKNAPQVEVLTREQAGVEPNVKGFYDPNTKRVTLIADNIGKGEDVHGLMRHEVAVHAKRLGKTDPEFQSILDRLQKLKEQGDATVAKAYDRVPKDTNPEHIHEEALAYLTQHAPNLPISKSFMSWMRRMAHKLTGSSDWLRSDDFAPMADAILKRGEPAAAPRKLKAVQRETVEEEITPPTPEEKAKLVEEAKKSDLTAVAQKGGLGSTVGSMMTSMVDKGILLPFQTAVFDERAPLGNALNKMGANVGTKLRGDLVYGAYSQRFNTIEQGINNGYTVMGRDGTLEAVNDSQLAPQKILERIRGYGKQLGMSDGEAWKVVSEMLVRLRAGTIREQDAKTRQEAQNYLSAADELSSYAATKATAEEKRKFREAAAKLRAQAQKKLDSIGDDGRTYVTKEEVEAGRKLYMAYKDTLSREVDNIHNLLKTVPDKLQAAGMIDAKTAKQYRDYPFYFPFYDKAQFDEAVVDPLKEETLNTFLSGMGRGLKSVAEVKRQERHGHTIYTADNLLRHIMYWDSAVAEHTARTITCEQLEMTGGATRLTGEPTDKNFVIKVKRDGKDTFYKIHDPTVYYAFQASAPVTGPIINVLRKMARFQRGVAVFNPLFWYKQVIRDPKQVSRIAKVGAITPIDALGELAKITTGKSEGYKRLVAKGVVGPVDVGSNPQERIQSLVQGKGVSEKVYNKLNEIHEAVDAATRAIVYNRAIAKYKKWGLGEDVADALAIKDAREVMNFSRRGKSQMLNTLRSVTPFLGSYINSIDVLLKAFSPEKYGRMSKADAMEMRRNFIGISSSMAVMSLGYSLAMSDDEEWVNNADRNGNILVRNPFSNRKEKPFIALPLEFEIGWLQHTLPENLILAQLGAIAPTTEKANLKESASKALMPPTDFFSYARPLINYVMTLEERNAPGGAPKGYEGLKEFQDEKATEISKMLAEELKSAGIQMLSPNDIENSMNSLFGGYWAVAQSVSTYMLANQEGKAVAPAKTLTESLPWFGKMFSGEYRDVAVRDAFKVLEEVQQVQNTFSKIKTTKDISKYNAFVASPEYVKAAQADKALNGLSEQITGISSKIATVTADTGITDPKKKREIIDELTGQREEIAREIVRRAKILGVFE